MIVSPTTLLATLRVIDSLWRQERQGQNAREIAERAGQLYDKFVAFVADLDAMGSRLQQLDKAYALSLIHISRPCPARWRCACRACSSRSC